MVPGSDPAFVFPIPSALRSPRVIQGRKVSISISQQSEGGEGIRLFSSCVYVACDLLTYSYCLNGQRLSFAEAQPVPVSLSLLFQACTEILLFPHQWQDELILL